MTDYRYAALRLANILVEELARAGRRADLGDRIESMFKTTMANPPTTDTPSTRVQEYRDEQPTPYGFLRSLHVEVSTDRPAEVEPATYALPGPPPIEYRVVDAFGSRWVHMPRRPGWFELVIDENAPNFHQAEPNTVWVAWPNLLDTYGPVTLDEWTDEEKRGFELYGPPGERWGNPDQECSHYACTIGHGHIGPHIDAAGDPIPPAPADGSAAFASITPQESAETPCTCGHPDRHREDCPRFIRTSGTGPDDTEERRARHEAAANDGSYCRHCDFFMGYGAAGVIDPPADKDTEWLATHCWGCGRTAEEIVAGAEPKKDIR